MKLIFLIFGLFIYGAGFAQTNLNGSFNSTATGRNVSFSVSKIKNNAELGLGIRYNMGMLAMPDNQNNIFYKRLYPSNFKQHWGAKTFFNYSILNNWEHVKPFVFCAIDVSYSTTRNVISNTITHRHGPFTWVEPYLGFGFKVNLPKNFYIEQKIGGGGMLIFGKDDILMKNKLAWEFGGILSAGIGYRF
jgi:hypothetical protein